jgi:exopolysaccharide production protein ExoZ
MLRSIQVARAVAVIGVLLCHLEWVRNDIHGSFNRLSDSWLLMGHGVDLFFCISGFIIAFLLSEERISPYNFFSRRIIRIYPLYWAFALSYVAATSVACRIGQRGECGRAYSAADVVNSLLLLPQQREPLLSVAWSLEHEVIFYAIAGLICVVWRKPLFRLFQVITLLGCAGVIAHVVIPRMTGSDLWDFHLFSLYHFEFAVGIAVFLMKDRLASLNPLLMTTLGVLGFVATGIGNELVAGPEDHIELPHTGLARLASTLGYAAASGFVLSGFLAAEARGYFKAGPRLWASFVAALILIGNASYALYLIQPLAYGLIGKAYRAASVDAVLLAPALAAAISATLIAGTLWFVLIERPFLRAVRPVPKPARRALT